MHFLLSADLKIQSVTNSLDPDQARHFIRPDLGPNCLQGFAEDDTCRKETELKLQINEKFVTIS